MYSRCGIYPLHLFVLSPNQRRKSKAVSHCHVARAQIMQAATEAVELEVQVKTGE